jgi:signal transduction histidine kinase
LLRVQRQKEELTALLVHDLKGPAAGIMMSADMRLRSRDVSELDRELWGHVHTAAEAINRMVMNMLDIARSEDGVFTTSPAAVDVPALIADVQRLMLPLAKSREQRIEAIVAPDIPSLCADAEVLRRVLQNLVDNAIRHSPVRTTVRLEATLAGETVRIAVGDEGSGIPSELRDRIFQKYVRLGPAPGTDDTFGRGLGLAFCRMAVDAHGGQIDVSDNEPRGTVFTVALPV